ncbi:hypothetical protein [uncultured Algibacter sp.]|uniref:hypothetical protein n=1 Tax=uncultured Algibacter sp. TaxID=298659 RepID=UPI00261761CD|nr:hypothetical protein [uncultured Algibacter sp.]
MRTVKTLFLVLAITFTSTIMAETSPKPIFKIDHLSELIQKEFSTFLKDSNFKIEKDEVAFVTIMFNKKNEIVVLSVDSQNKDVEFFIKTKLNYKKLPVKNNQKYKRYKFPIRLSAN